MIIAMIVIEIILVGVLIGCVRAMWCNTKTLHQRIRLYPAVADPSFWEKVRWFERVRYHQHFWALFFFRDPMTLYGAAP